MNKLYAFVTIVVSFLLININAQSQQAFNKGSLLVSVTEGSTYANYTATDMTANSDVVHTEHMGGVRDPFSIEYGISKRWGIGLTSGGDYYWIAPSFYGFEASDKFKSWMSEFTIDGYCHFFVTKHIDLSGFGSLGPSSVYFKGSQGDVSYNYKSGGGIARIGVKARYYVWKGLGVLCMLSAFTTSDASVNGNTVGQGYTTNIRGTAIEFGLCYRILR